MSLMLLQHNVSGSNAFYLITAEQETTKSNAASHKAVTF
jgi:hypothetical protein